MHLNLPESFRFFFERFWIFRCFWIAPEVVTVEKNFSKFFCSLLNPFRTSSSDVPPILYSTSVLLNLLGSFFDASESFPKSVDFSRKSSESLQALLESFRFLKSSLPHLQVIIHIFCVFRFSWSSLIWNWPVLQHTHNSFPLQPLLYRFLSSFFAIPFSQSVSSRNLENCRQKVMQ